jgi:hypothetical protein
VARIGNGGFQWEREISKEERKTEPTKVPPARLVRRISDAMPWHARHRISHPCVLACTQRGRGRKKELFAEFLRITKAGIVVGNSRPAGLSDTLRLAPVLLLQCRSTGLPILYRQATDSYLSVLPQTGGVS